MRLKLSYVFVLIEETLKDRLKTPDIDLSLLYKIGFNKESEIFRQVTNNL